ncbi:TetR-like C-terminal domain-containing protein [Minwuia sp.]|uniref:TetR-like C-terminal domain-containing protein n=1 Tax=Minwuia sp. TaxID=2493630 RepID=UPI003A8E5A1C
MSVRKLAIAAGVSHNAPYMHFQDRDALIAAIAAAGFQDLQETITRASDASEPDWQHRFKAGCHAYVMFAIQHPVRYATMHLGFDPDTHPETHAASIRAFGQLKQHLADGQKAGAIKDMDTHQMAIGVWASLHGLSGILRRPSGKHPISGMPAEDILEDTLDLLLHGIAA